MRCIALDIDGTMTSRWDSIPSEIVKHLKSLYERDWRIMIVTGRGYSFSKKLLSSIGFPYIFASQNGAAAWHMPERREIFTEYMNLDDFKYIEKNCEDLDIFFIIYGEDQCYSKSLKKHEYYVNNFSKSVGAKVGSLDNVKNFPLVKCIGNIKDILFLKKRLLKKGFNLALIKDKYVEDFYLLLVTKRGIDKGSVISRVFKKRSFLIVAGNDDNDLSMFRVADIKIAMEDSPKHLLDEADIYAKPAKDLGLLEALERAVSMAEDR